MKREMQVAELYSGRSVLVTGFSGLIGKLLVEKLLWSCPQVHRIYILLRTKRGSSPQQRLKDITDLFAFDRVREKYPGVLEEKLTAISGDIGEDGLGLSDADRESLCRDVSIVFHVAASVRFDDPLPIAIHTNTLGTKRVLDLAIDMHNLECFLHVSTAYSNCEHALTKERLYPAKVDWRDLIQVKDAIHPATLQILSNKLMGEAFNTYTFTKGVTEQVVNDMRHRLPVVTVRPSVVVPASKEPVPGWMDNQYGPLTMNLSVITGMTRCSTADPDAFSNYIPTDYVVNAILLAAYKKVQSEDKNYNPIYNVCSPPSWKCTNEQYMKLHQQHQTQAYLDKEGINFARCQIIRSSSWFGICFLYSHMISALFIDLLLILMNKSPMFTRTRRMLYLGIMRVRTFSLRSFSFETDNFQSLKSDLTEEDRTKFGWDFDSSTMTSVYHDAIVLAKRVLLKPLYKNIQLSRTILKGLYYLDGLAVLFTYSALVCTMYSLGMHHYCLQAISSFFQFPPNLSSTSL